MSRKTTGALLLATLALLIGAASASATFPGTNGNIAFVGTPPSGSCSGPGCVPSNRVYTVGFDGSGLKAQTLPSLGAQSPAWSPSGKLAYVVDGLMFVRTASLKSPTITTPKGVRARSIDNLTWAANGRQFYLRAATTSGTSGILLAGSSLPTAKVLLRATDVQDMSASPNGKQLAFVSNGSLYVAGVNGSNPTSLVSGVGSVDWSPDSSRLVTSVSGAIWTMSPTGANRTQVTQAPSAATNWQTAAMPSFTPDGQSIVFLLYGTNPDATPADIQAAQTTHGIATISTSGTNQQVIVPNSTVSPNLADGPVVQPVG